MNPSDPIRMDRRLAIKWMLAASAGAVLMGRHGFASPALGAVSQSGYGQDPDMVKASKPGDFWPLLLTDAQRRDVAVLADIVIPAESDWPSASSVGVTDFIDEWVSAPYPDNLKARKVILEGLGWVDQESRRRHSSPFADAPAADRLALCDEMARREPYGSPQAFFKLFRDLVSGGYFTTPVGMRDLGYVGNVPLPKYEGPPAELLAKLGLADEQLG